MTGSPVVVDPADEPGSGSKKAALVVRQDRLRCQT
jgi:hypothetical protein